MTKTKTQKSWYIDMAIVIAIYALFQFILPAPEPITRAGMGVAGIFIATLYLWIKVDIGWPSLLFVGVVGLTGVCSGTNLFAESGAVDSFSVAAALYMEQVQIVTTNPDIKTVEDLKGKTVSIGALGSGVYFNAVDVLGVYGIDAEKDITPVYQSFGDSAESLKDGKIDAAFIVAGAPTTAITDLATASSVYLVSIDDEHMDTLLASSPYYARSTISADTYGTPDDVQTVAVAAVVLVRDDVSADAVYKLSLIHI